MTDNRPEHETSSRFRYRVRILAVWDRIIADLDAGYGIREIRGRVGLGDIPERAWYRNIRTLRQERRAAPASRPAGALAIATAPVPAQDDDSGADPEADRATKPPSTARRKRRFVAVTVGGENADDAFNPRKWNQEIP